MIQNLLKLECKYRVTRSSAHSFAHTPHLFACSTLLALLTRFAALTHSLARSLIQAHGTARYFCLQNRDFNPVIPPLIEMDEGKTWTKYCQIDWAEKWLSEWAMNELDSWIITWNMLGHPNVRCSLLGCLQCYKRNCDHLNKAEYST